MPRFLAAAAARALSSGESFNDVVVMAGFLP
jgi:hypothetical protein